MVETSKLNRIAVHTLATSRPSIHWSATPIIMALITNKKSPKLINVRGMVMMISSGFKVAFRRPRMMATPTAVEKLLMLTPGSIQSAKKTAMELTTSLERSPGFCLMFGIFTFSKST